LKSVVEKAGVHRVAREDVLIRFPVLFSIGVLTRAASVADREHPTATETGLVNVTLNDASHFVAGVVLQPPLSLVLDNDAGALTLHSQGASSNRLDHPATLGVDDGLVDLKLVALPQRLRRHRREQRERVAGLVLANGHNLNPSGRACGPDRFPVF